MKCSRLIEAFGLSALAFWLGLAVTTGVTAAVAFPIAKSLDPHIPSLAALPDAHWKIAAGSIANRVFGLASYGELGAGIVVAGALVFSRGWVGRRAWLARLVLCLPALVTVAYSTLVLIPKMTSTFHGLVEAARAGDAARAVSLRAVFDAAHPGATQALVAMTIATLAATLAWIFTGPMGRDTLNHGPPTADNA